MFPVGHSCDLLRYALFYMLEAVPDPGHCTMSEYHYRRDRVMSQMTFYSFSTWRILPTLNKKLLMVLRGWGSKHFKGALLESENLVLQSQSCQLGQVTAFPWTLCSSLT